MVRHTINGMHAARPARRVAAALAASVASALLLSACASLPPGFGGPTSIADEEGPGWPANAPVPEREWEGPVEPVAWWNLGETRETLTFISYWSSSCPFMLTELDVVNDGLVRAVFRQPVAQACTDDLAPSYHVVAAPEGLTAPEVLAEVEWRSPAGEGDRVQDFTIVVIDPNVEPVFPPASVAIDEYPGLPPLLPEPSPDAPLPDGPQAFWLSPVLELADERELTIVTYGSSSCPVIPTALDVGLAPDTIGITLQERRAPDTFCTEDYGPFTSVLSIPLEAAATATSVVFSTLGPGGDRSERRVEIVDLAG